jgi:bacillithiol biosynthesis cysteine-adding enzyme BshC
MDPACIRHTDLPGTTKLFADFAYHFDRVARFYKHDPHDPDSLRAVASAMDYPDDRRAALVQALRAQNGDSESLRKLAQPGTVAIVTGQQVGLFSGPAYTIYKAITAANVAQSLSAQGIPAVAVFWLATEDHDFEEVNHAWTFDAGHQPLKLAVPSPNDTNGRQRPAGGIVIEQPPVDQLAQALAAFPHGDEVIAMVREAYPKGVTMGAGFRNLLKKLLAKLDLIYLDPLDPAIRKISVPVVVKALEAAPELKQRLLARNRELEAAGYHAQVLIEEKTSLFFLLENGERVPLRRKDSEYGDLRDRAAEVSPNALLRPVVQDYLLPTAAYIGGPAELAYFAQAEVLYDRLLGRMPVMMSRASFTLLEPRTAKLLKRYGMTVAQALVDEETLESRVARQHAPPAIMTAFDSTAGSIESAIGKLRRELTPFDPTLTAALDKSRAKMEYQLAKSRRKIERELVRRDERAESDAQYLANLLYPHRHLQERFYSILPFVAEHGLDLIDQLFATAQVECPDHRVVTI